ncbi:hypothetical protein BDM02DRAFT_3166836 [Thelephora ganbajun]|uniref:Uncharacterized protein n=1 Tax=Thelephora ganbajun TaxID=370292 RepID=A0ACB6ZHN7_THEGA|nr:hypothetical protein BDM02DRAFT_3166836 [Thelephora ganbajun]
MARLDRLCSEEDNDDGLWDENEREHRAELFDTLRLINDNGNMLYHRINGRGYNECQDDIQTASAMADDIRDAIVDYQMAQQRTIYDMNDRLIDAADLSVLNSCRRAHGVGHQHGDRKGCLRGTRETVLNEIESWARDFEKPPVFWLNGLAGTGKSTIAKTVSEWVFADGKLGASFFCSRDFEDRSNLHLIFPTLAFQLAHKYPTFRSVLIPLLRSNPDIVHEPLTNQMRELIVGPLKSADVWTVIVIDALDECGDEEPQSAILSVLGRFVERIPKVKFFITGRPEPRIKTGFRLPLLVNSTDTFVLHDIHPSLVHSDIRLFLKHELSEVARRRRVQGWPSDEDIDVLCHRAGGLFIYAVATVKFLDSSTRLPERQLDVIVNFPEHTGHEGKTRLNSKTFWISPEILHLELAMNCLRVMNNGLGRNLLSLPDYALNSEVGDLETRIDDRISDALRYACRSWHSHLTKTEGDVADMVSHLRTFLEEKFLVWLEVVSVLGAVRGAIVGLEQLIIWLKKVSGNEELLETARDYSRFVVTFFEPISVSATHIYHSALELSPLSSIVRKRYYCQRYSSLPRVMVGTWESWEEGIIIPSKDRCRSYTWSPCGQFIATGSFKAVEIRDPLSLELLSTIPTPGGIAGLLAYSADGRFIASLCGTSLVIWDIQTGGVAKEIDHGGAENRCLVWSLDGSTVAIVGCEGARDRTWVVRTYDVASGATHSPGTLESTDEPQLWADGTSFRVMATRWSDGTCTINIFEVGSILTETECFHIGTEYCTIGPFSQTTHRISYSDYENLAILDFRHSRYSLKEEGFFGSHCFSPDGSLFAASKFQSVHIWEYNSRRYARWRKVSIPDLSTSSLRNSLRFSPTSPSLLGYCDGILKLWRLDGPPIDAHHQSYEQFVILSRCGGYIVASHQGDRVVTTTNLLSQTPPYVIDTNIAVRELALTGNILLVLDYDTIAAWRLTKEGVVDGVCADGRARRGNTIWTIQVRSDLPRLLVQDQTVVIEEGGKAIHTYHTGTGEPLKPVQLNPRWWDHRWGGMLLGDFHVYGWDTPTKGIGPPSWDTLREGWVKDLEGNHLLWLPVEWRDYQDIASRSCGGTALWLGLTESSVVIIKF